MTARSRSTSSTVTAPSFCPTLTVRGAEPSITRMAALSPIAPT